MDCCCQVASVTSDSVWPHRRQPTRLRHSWDSPGKNTGVGCHFLLQCMKVKSESEVAQSCPTPSTPRTAAYQAPPSMGFSRQEYWSGVPLPSPRVNLELQLIIIPGRDRSVSTYQLLWSFSSLPDHMSGHMWLFTASQPWEARDALNLLKTGSLEKLENY